MLFISQKSWVSDDLESLRRHVNLIKTRIDRTTLDSSASNPVLLLPHAEVGLSVPTGSSLFKDLGTIALESKVFIAGSVVLQKKSDNANSIYGFLIGSDGKLLLEVEKISPELINGLAINQTCAIGKSADFKVANTPIGQIGILPGEDILFPHYARSLVWKGAEIIFNPVSEVADDFFEARQNARIARAFENSSFVATASAVSRVIDGDVISYPNASGLSDWNGRQKIAKSNSDFIEVDNNGVAQFATVHSLQLPTYTVTQANALSNKVAGQLIYVSNGNGGAPCLAVYNGSNWQQVRFDGVISAA